MNPEGAELDVVVVGNGILGLSLAGELVRRAPELRVAVVGPAAREGGASQAAGAMLGCLSEVTVDTHNSAAGRAKFALALEAHRRWPDRLAWLESVARAEGERLHRVEGTHVVLNAAGGELDSLNFAAMLASLEALGEPWEEVAPADVPGLRPRPDARPLRAVFLPGEGAVDSRQVLRLIEAGLRRQGVRLIDAAVRELVVDRAGRVTGAELSEGGSVTADTVVLAAGAFSNRLADTALPRHTLQPILSGAGVAVRAERVAGEGFSTVVRTPNRSGSCGLHLIPLPQRAEYLGATNVVFAEPELRTYLGVQHFLLDCAIRQLDEQIFLHRTLEWRIGNRPVALDGFPMVGWVNAAHLYVLTGTYRDGFHCAPALAEHAAAEILEGRGVLTLPFAPDRRPLPSRSVAESVDDYVVHMTAGWFEARAGQPMHIPTAGLAGYFRREAEDLYERLEVDIGLGPDVLMFLLASRKDPADVEAVRAYLKEVANQ